MNTTQGTSVSHSPAFLTEHHRGMAPKGRPQRSRKQRRKTKTLARALRALPMLTADLGYNIASYRNAKVEVLPGSPTTIIFSAGNTLTGMLVVPFTEAEARSRLGLPPITRPILSAHQLFEKLRQHDQLMPDEQVAVAQHEAWGV